MIPLHRFLKSGHAYAAAASLILVASACGGESTNAVRFGFPLDSRSPSAWCLDHVWPELRFHEPVCTGPIPKGTAEVEGEFFVASRRGALWRIAGGRQNLLIDLRSVVSQDPKSDDGLLSVAFHPEFAVQGSPHLGKVFVFYKHGIAEEHRYVLSRFDVRRHSDENFSASETTLIVQPVGERRHVGGSLAFGPDGCLYVSVGDGSGDNDHERHAQQIDERLFSGILRLDVDRRGSPFSHPIRRQPSAGRTGGYFIPDNNPFVGVDDALEEFWSIGFRNPFSMHFDDATEALWVGEVGQDRVEQIHVAESGSNHGWSFREGSTPYSGTHFGGVAPKALRGDLKVPFYEYEHRDLDNCAIGGFIYHGQRFPELVGKYLFGDYGSGRIYALTIDGDRMGQREELLRLPGEAGHISSFGRTPEGEILVCVWKWDSDDGAIMTLARADDAVAPLPRSLSQTSLFDDLATLRPRPELTPYDVRLPFWSGSVNKRRWISLAPAADGRPQKIAFSEDAAWTFPPGTIFVKHFEALPDKPAGGAPKRLETRVIVRDSADGIYAVTYRWNEEGTDAFLVDDREFVPLPVRDDQSPSQWSIPSRTDCIACHTASAGHVLGVQTRQLGGVSISAADGPPTEQLSKWAASGWFDREFTSEELASLPRHPLLDDASTPLQARVRAYLDVNCSHCHRPGTGVIANVDLRASTPMEHTYLTGNPTIKGFGIPNAHAVRFGSLETSILYRRFTSEDPGQVMPPLAAHGVDPEGERLLAAWIDGPASSNPGAVEEESESGSGLKSVSIDLTKLDNRFSAFGVPPNETTNSVSGLRIVMRRDFYATPSAGLRLPVRLSGDFEITTDFHLLNVPRPRGGHGAGMSLVIQSAANGPWASLQRVLLRDESHVAVGHLADVSAAADVRHSVLTADVPHLRGRLRFARTGSTLRYLWAVPGSDDFREIRSVEFGAADVISLELAAQNGEQANDVDIEWENLTIRAEEIVLPEERVEGDRPTSSPIPSSPIFWAIWASTPLAFLLVWIGLRLRGVDAANDAVQDDRRTS